VIGLIWLCNKLKTNAWNDKFLMVCLFMVCNQLKIINALKTKPNVVIFLSDDLGWNDIGYHGSRHLSTPNIDSLAADGISLKSLLQSTLMCPSRGALLTGSYIWLYFINFIENIYQFIWFPNYGTGNSSHTQWNTKHCAIGCRPVGVASQTQTIASISKRFWIQYSCDREMALRFLSQGNTYQSVEALTHTMAFGRHMKTITITRCLKEVRRIRFQT